MYGYVRVSTELQAHKGYSLAGQVQAIKDYCIKNGYELIHIYCDAGLSGAVNDSEDDLAKRPELNAMLGKLKYIDKIVVFHTNRLWRNIMAQALIQRALRKFNIDIVSVEQPSYSVYNEEKDPTAFLLNGMMDLLDLYDKGNVVNRLKKGKENKAKQGDKPSGAPPIGYLYNNKKVIIDTKWAALIKTIFNQYLGLGSLGKVAIWLNDNNYVTPRGKAFSTMALHHILTNEFYLGQVQWCGKLTDGNHEPIISKVIFGKVKAMLNRNRKNG